MNMERSILEASLFAIDGRYEEALSLLSSAPRSVAVLKLREHAFNSLGDYKSAIDAANDAEKLVSEGAAGSSDPYIYGHLS